MTNLRVVTDIPGTTDVSFGKSLYISLDISFIYVRISYGERF